MNKQQGFVFPALGLTSYAAIAVGLILVLFMLRMHWIQVGREEILQANVQAAVKIVREQGKATERVVVKYIKLKGETQVKTEVIEKEVIRYENAKLDQCPLSNGFVSLHDSAALDILPDAARSVDGTSSGIEASKALSVVTANYATCHQTALRLRMLQEWIREQQKVNP